MCDHVFSCNNWYVYDVWLRSDFAEFTDSSGSYSFWISFILIIWYTSSASARFDFVPWIIYFLSAVVLFPSLEQYCGWYSNFSSTFFVSLFFFCQAGQYYVPFPGWWNLRRNTACVFHSVLFGSGRICEVQWIIFCLVNPDKLHGMEAFNSLISTILQVATWSSKTTQLWPE